MKQLSATANNNNNNNNNSTTLRERIPPSSKSNPGCESGLIRIRARISAGSLPKCCIFYSVVAKFRRNRLVTCVRNANKSPKFLFCNGDGSGKLIRNPYPGTDHHQKLISSSDWQAQLSHQVSMKSADYFFSNPAHKTTHKTPNSTNHITSLQGRRHSFESGGDFFLTPHFLASGGDKILLR